MNKGSSNHSKLVDKSAVRALFFGSSLVTLAFWHSFADPFNPLKLSFIVYTATWLFGHLFVSRKELFRNKQLRNLGYLVGAFIAMLGIATALTDVKYTALFGDHQRNNGFIMYVGLSIILIAAAVYIRFENINMLFYTSSILGLILAIYGILQMNGIDFVLWNNPYNAVISTLGNPNFAAAVMSIVAILNLGVSSNRSFSVFFRISSAFVFILLLCAIYLSNARQGLLSLILGVTIYFIVWIYSSNKKVGVIACVFALSGAVMAVLGLLQVGPLTSVLYKNSVSIRGYYWRAGVEMFQSHPWFGIGVDRYIAGFKQYREVAYPLNYGFDITSSNAHNIPIQFFATGGIFVGLLYLVLASYILWRGVLGIKNNSGSKRMAMTSILAAWISYQSTSFVSIDSPGVVVWGWLIGGAIVGLSFQSESDSSEQNFMKQTSRKSVSAKSLQPLISFPLTVAVMVVFSFIYRNEIAIEQTSRIPSEIQNYTYVKNISERNLKKPLLQPFHKIRYAVQLGNSEFFNEAILVLEEVNKIDKKNIIALDLLAAYYYEIGKTNLAIEQRVRIISLDPWGANNYYLLGLLYLDSGDLEKMEKMREKVLSFAANTEIGSKAKTELVP